MSDEIVSRLFRNRKKMTFLNEGHLNEADKDKEDDEFEDASGADEEYVALNAEEEEEEHDDSQAPVQGNPDDEEPTEATDDEESTEDMESPAASHNASAHAPMREPATEGEPEEEELPPEVSDEELEEKPAEYENPLDNQYAVHFTLGDEISLTTTGVQNSDTKSGVIEGYDPEGFYKVRWSDDSITNGLTDIALEELVKNNAHATANESRCVCGSRKFVREDDQVVCDHCGRLHESTLDALTLADKSRPKGKRMIRSEAHPVSTANRPNIAVAEAIRKAFKGKSINEEDDPEIEENSFSKLQTELSNEFWTRQAELKDDIEELGYTVEEMNNEYVIVSSEEEYEDVWKIPIEGTSRTFYLNFDKARLI